MTLKNAVLGNLRWMLFAKLGSQIIAWGSTLLVMRILRPEDYGLIAMAAILVSLMTMINEMGLGQAIIQADQIDEYAIRQCFGLVILVNSASYVILCALAPLVAWFFQEEKLSIIIPVIGIQFLIQIFMVVPSALLDRTLRFRERSVYEVAVAIAGAGATLLMAFQGLGVWAIIFGNLLMAAMLTFLINWRFPFAHYPVFNFKGLSAIARYGFFTVLNRLLWYFYSQADTLMVGRLLGKSVLGFYSVGIQIASLPLVKVSGIFNQLALAAFSQIKNDRERIAESVILVARAASFFAVPVFWGIASIASDLVKLVLGSDWEPAVVPLQCIALILPVRVLSIAIAQAVNAVGRPDLNVINLAVACLVMPAAFAVGIFFWGLNGVCYAWILAYPAWFLYVLRQGLPKLNLSLFVYVKSTSLPYLFGALMFMVVFVSRDLLPFNQLVRLIFLVALGAMFYALVFFVFARKYAVEAMSTLRMDRL